MPSTSSWFVLALMALAFPLAEARSEPESYQCFIPQNHDSPLREVGKVECAVGAQAWEYVWYYPPVVYQVWCFLTDDCPCPHCPGMLPGRVVA